MVYLNKQQLGLVLAGGGAKGAYQIGVLQALAKLGLTAHSFAAISGTSIGALNLAVFVQNDLALAEQIWLSVTKSQIFSLNPRFWAAWLLRYLPAQTVSNKLLSKWIASAAANGMFSRRGLLNIIDTYLDLHLLAKHLTGIISAACMQIIPPKVCYFTFNGQQPTKIKSILLASSAIPLVYKPVMINQKAYLDGGIIDNIPIRPVYNQGCRIIFVIHLSRAGTVNFTKYPDCKLIEIVPSRSLGSFATGTLDFSHEGIKQRIELGYQDGIRIIEPVLKFADVHTKALDYLQHIKEGTKNDAQ